MHKLNPPHSWPPHPLPPLLVRSWLLFIRFQGKANTHTHWRAHTHRQDIHTHQISHEHDLSRVDNPWGGRMCVESATMAATFQGATELSVTKLVVWKRNTSTRQQLSCYFSQSNTRTHTRARDVPALTSPPRCHATLGKYSEIAWNSPDRRKLAKNIKRQQRGAAGQSASSLTTSPFLLCDIFIERGRTRTKHTHTPQRRRPRN